MKAHPFLLNLFLLVGLASILSAAELPVAQDPATIGLDPAVLATIDAAMQAKINQNDVAGIVAGVIRNGKIGYLKTWGLRDIQANQPMPEDAIFRIASMTKALTSAAALSIYDDGLFDLDEDISDLMPEWKNATVRVGGQNVPLKNAITPRMLMSHTAGFYYGNNTPPGITWFDDPNRLNLDELSKVLAAKYPLKFQPGEGYSYGFGLDIMARYLEVVTGKTFDIILKERLLDPLDMKDTGWHVPPEKADRIATVYTKGFGGEQLTPAESNDAIQILPRWLSGGGKMVSTTRDYMRFCQMLLNGGELDGNRIVESDTLLQMTHENHVPPAVGIRHGFGGSNNGEGAYYWGGAKKTRFWIHYGDAYKMSVVFMVQSTGYQPTAWDEFNELAQQAIIEPSLSPQWLFAAGDPAGIGNLFAGVAVSNYSGEAAGVGLEAIGDSISGKAAGEGDLQPLGANEDVNLDLPAGEQFADLRSNIFEGDVTLPAWIELTSDNSDIASFFQFGSGALTQLDGGVAIENLATKFFFQRVFDGPGTFRGQAATTRLTVLNPNDEEVSVDLNYLPPDDGPLGQPRQATRKIPARAFLDETASDLFGTSLSGGYVACEVTEGGAVAAFELVQLSDRTMVLGLNASTGNSSTRSFSAQLASRPDVFTNVNLINTTASTRNVDLTAVRTDGGIEGNPVKIVLAAGASFSSDSSQIFGFAVPADGRLQGGQFVGSLEVEADGDGVVGDVIFGDTGGASFAASLPLQSEPFTEAVFSQFADIPGLFFTGLAFYYPGDIGSSPQGGAPDAEITVEVVLANGESVGESSFKLSPGERTDKSISDLAPAAAGKMNGYMLVTSTEPLIGQVVFVALGGGGITLFSAVPPKVIR